MLRPFFCADGTTKPRKFPEIITVIYEYCQPLALNQVYLSRKKCVMLGNDRGINSVGASNSRKFYFYEP